MTLEEAKIILAGSYRISVGETREEAKRTNQYNQALDTILDELKRRELRTEHPESDLMHTACLLCGKHAVSVPWNLVGLPYANYSYCSDCIRKAIKLLKEQEPVIVHDPGGICPKCRMPIYPEDHPQFCGHCGQAVKWE